MKKGSIHLAKGPMFSGKTEWLIKKMQQYKDGSLVIRYTNDTRYSEDSITSHSGLKMFAKKASDSNEVEELITNNNFFALGIDEIQFFDIRITEVLRNLKDSGVKVFAAGLDTDFMKAKWETTEQVGKYADELVHLRAICSVCKQHNALYSKRIINSEDRIMIGGNGSYEARCEEHFDVSYS